MSKKILTVGFELASGTSHHEGFSSKTSLLDWDIVLFRPTIKTYWTEEAKKFGARFTSAIVSLDKALHSSAEMTPEPEWASREEYALATEQKLRAELLNAEQQLEFAQKQKEDVLERLRGAGRLRSLLYENGRPLEFAIVEALKLLGFRAAPYKEADSEFDVVFESEEGRLLGEAEGKDSKAINIDKLRQLAMNIHEDLQREEVLMPAKGVLFGNGYRLSPPSERKTQFTDKCVSASKTSGTTLVATTELFTAVQYLANHEDVSYAKKCRETMLSGIGVTTLPKPPEPIVDQSPTVKAEKY
jgi:hypothetical protein